MSFLIKTEPYISTEPRGQREYHAFVDLGEGRSGKRLLGSSYRSQKHADQEAREKVLRLALAALKADEHSQRRIIGCGDGSVLVVQWDVGLRRLELSARWSRSYARLRIAVLRRQGFRLRGRRSAQARRTVLRRRAVGNGLKNERVRRCRYPSYRGPCGPYSIPRPSKRC